MSITLNNYCKSFFKIKFQRFYSGIAKSEPNVIWVLKKLISINNLCIREVRIHTSNYYSAFVNFNNSGWGYYSNAGC